MSTQAITATIRTNAITATIVSGGITEGGGGDGSGDMLASVYDPQGIESDIFASASATVFVSKSGSNDASGRNINLPKLTIGSAVTAAEALITAGATGVRVEVMDGETYTEDIALEDGISLHAPAAIIVGALTLPSGSQAILNKHFTASNNQVAVNKTGGSGHGFYKANVLDCRGTGGALTGCQGLRNVSNGSVLFSHIGVLFVGASGIGIGDTATGFGHIHFWSPDLYLGGNNAIGIQASSASTNIIGYIDHILEIGTPTGTTAINITNANAIVKATITEIIADTAYNITAGSLHLLTSKITGTRTGTPVFEISPATVTTKRVQVTATDGATPAIDCASGTEVYVKWEAGTSATAPAFSNVVIDSVIHLSVKKTIAGDVAITFSQSGYDFAFEGEAAAASKVVTLSGDANSFWSVSLNVTAHEISTDKVVTITGKGL